MKSFLFSIMLVAMPVMAKPPNPYDPSIFDPNRHALVLKKGYEKPKQTDLECPIKAESGDSMETLKLKVQLIKAWQAEQNAKKMAIYWGNTRLSSRPVTQGSDEDVTSRIEHECGYVVA